MLPPDPPKVVHRDFDPSSAPEADEDVDMRSDDGPAVEINSVEINILIYLYLLESGFSHTAFSLLSESNMRETDLFKHFHPSFPVDSASGAGSDAKSRRANGGAGGRGGKDKDKEPLFGRENGRIGRGELVRKLWKGVRWEEVERHISASGEIIKPVCPNPFHLLLPHVCPPNYPSSAQNPPQPLPLALRSGPRSPPPKRLEAFPPPPLAIPSAGAGVKAIGSASASASASAAAVSKGKRKAVLPPGESPDSKRSSEKAEKSGKGEKAEEKGDKEKKRKKARLSEVAKDEEMEVDGAKEKGKEKEKEKEKEKDKGKGKEKEKEKGKEKVGGKGKEREREETREEKREREREAKREEKREKEREEKREREREMAKPEPATTAKGKKKTATDSLRVPSAAASRSTTPGNPSDSRKPSPRPPTSKDKDLHLILQGDVSAGGAVTTWQQHRDFVTVVAWNPKDLDTLASGSGDGFVRLWDFQPPASGQSVATLTLKQKSTAVHHQRIESNKKIVDHVAWHPDGTVFTTGGQDGLGRVYMPDGQYQGVMTWGQGSVTALQYSPSGTMLMMGKSDFSVSRWVDKSGGMVMNMNYDGHTKEVNDVDWLDDHVFASAANDHNIRVFHAEDRRPRYTLKGHTDDVTRIRWSPLIPGKPPAARLLASVSDDGNCMIWRLPAYPQPPAGAPAAAREAAVAALAVPGGRGKSRSASPVKKHDSDEDDYFANANGKAEHCLHRMHVVSGSENKRMNTLEWSPVADGGKMILAAGGQDSTVKLFDATSGTTLHVLSGLESGTGSLAFSPRSFPALIANHPNLASKVGKLGLLAAGGWDGLLKIWDVESGKVVAEHEVEEDERRRQSREMPMFLSMSWRDDGKHLACGLFNKTVMVVNILKALENGVRSKPEAKGKEKK
ncbi:hypothetical protein IAT38_002725 [Cryptococcus sp. DSM 104549]